jgi:hypothetical protein
MRHLAGLVALACLAACSSGSDKSAALTLNDPFWAHVNVQAVLTTSTDCDNRGAGYVATKEFVMTKDTTHKIIAPNAEIVCWRHDRDPNNPVPGDWSDWSKATLFPGQSVDTDL